MSALPCELETLPGASQGIDSSEVSSHNDDSMGKCRCSGGGSGCGYKPRMVYPCPCLLGSKGKRHAQLLDTDGSIV